MVSVYRCYVACIPAVRGLRDGVCLQMLESRGLFLSIFQKIIYPNHSVKKLLSVDDLTTNYLVYSPLAYNRPDDNWLLDVELYSEEFRADLISIWMDEMGLISNPAMRKQVKNYRAYFNAKDRRLKVSTQNKVPETPA